MAYPYSSSAYQGTQFFPQPQGTAYNPYGCACNS